MTTALEVRLASGPRLAQLFQAECAAKSERRQHLETVRSLCASAAPLAV